jgi:uncharacterized protein YdaU (DUF1376 family)
VNFYKRFIGDIQAKTGHLSMSEFGAYDRLLDHYYSTEKPIPADKDECYRICRAMSKDERKSVDKVLDRFFDLTPDGYAQSKADEVIAHAQPLIEAARANGKKGGRPRKPKTQQEPSGFEKETQQEPSSKASQSQISPSLRSGEGSASRLPKPFVLPGDWADFCRQERPDLDPSKVGEKFADYWHGKPGTGGKKLDWLATWRNWVREERGDRRAAPAKHSAAAAGIFDTPRGHEVIDV